MLVRILDDVVFTPLMKIGGRLGSVAGLSLLFYRFCLLSVHLDGLSVVLIVEDCHGRALISANGSLSFLVVISFLSGVLHFDFTVDSSYLFALILVPFLSVVVRMILFAVCTRINHTSVLGKTLL